MPRYLDTWGDDEHENPKRSLNRDQAKDGDVNRPTRLRSRSRTIEPVGPHDEKIMVDDGSYNDDDAVRGFRRI